VIIRLELGEVEQSDAIGTTGCERVQPWNRRENRGGSRVKVQRVHRSLHQASQISRSGHGGVLPREQIERDPPRSNSDGVFIAEAVAREWLV
jgi:hypothetical protein